VTVAGVLLHAEAGGLLLAVAPGLRMFGLAPVQRALDRVMRVGASPIPPDRVGRAIDRVGRRLPLGTGCLPQALVAQAMLVRRGTAATVHLGMGKPEGQFEAHAWTETAAGVVIGDERRADVRPLHSWARTP
jgi:hypothetical protein